MFSKLTILGLPVLIALARQAVAHYAPSLVDTFDEVLRTLGLGTASALLAPSPLKPKK